MRTPARVAALLIATATAAMAHPGHGESGLAAGFSHPVLGLDHLLAMVAVGLLGVRSGGKGLWLLPLSFMSAMVIGGLIALAGVGMPGAEWAIALSVLVFGVLVALASPPRLWVGCAMVGAFALIHGHAHIAEMQTGQSFALYAVGFLAATALLHAGGIVGGLLIKRGVSATTVRYSGAAIAAASLLLFMQLARG